MLTLNEQLDIFISPHLDDICFSSFIAIKNSNKSGKALIIDVFNQSCWTFLEKIDPKNHLKITNIRYKEEMSFVKHVEAEVIFLDFKDTSLRYQDLGEEYGQYSHKDPIYVTVKNKLINTIYKYNNINHIYIPLGISDHIDHLICRDILLQDNSLKTKALLYEDLPYIANFSEDYIRKYIDNLNCDLVATVYNLDSAKEKKIAMEIYKSQLEKNTIEKIINYGLLIDNKTNFSERYWRIFQEGSMTRYS